MSKLLNESAVSAPLIFDSIKNSTDYQNSKKQLLETIKQKISKITAPKPANSNSELKKAYEESIAAVGQMRGRELFFKGIGSGAGNGPFIELGDGSVKYDLITGIGVNFFGHSNLELFEAQFDSLWCDLLQGNLSPNPEYGALMKALLDSVGEKSKLKNVWLTSCGATANEVALKIVRQKKSPASKIMAFRGCFAGRTTALQELTDNAKYREGQPVYGEISYLPFFDAKSSSSAAEQATAVIAQMKMELAKYPGQFAALEFELVQGEGGFNVAPREFILPIILEAKKAGLYIWNDEIQTFGRTGEVFCYQRLGLDEYIDVVTVAKLLQTGAVLYTAELNPKPGLVSGTFAGSSGGLKAGTKILEILKTKINGPKGRVMTLEKICKEEFEKIKAGPNGKHLVDYTVFGGMIAFTLFDGSMDKVKKYLTEVWNLGAIAFFCGHDPYRVRMLPPFGVMTDEQCRDVFKLLNQAISNTAISFTKDLQK